MKKLLLLILALSITSEISAQQDSEKLVPFIEIPPEIAKEIAPEKPTQSSGEVDGLHYRALPAETVESMNLAAVKQSFIVSGRITESNLRKALNIICSELSAVGGFKCHEHPNAILVWLYPTEEDADAGWGRWVAMLDKSEDGSVRVDIKEEVLKDLNTPPEMKMGLSDETRRQIYRELVLAQGRAAREANRLYPLSPENRERNAETFLSLENRYKLDLTEKYRITSAQLEEITTEGIMKYWTLPKIQWK